MAIHVKQNAVFILKFKFFVILQLVLKVTTTNSLIVFCRI